MHENKIDELKEENYIIKNINRNLENQIRFKEVEKGVLEEVINKMEYDQGFSQIFK